MDQLTLYLIGLLLDFGSLYFSLFVAETTVEYKRGSLKRAFFASVLTLFMWRAATLLQLFIPSPFVVALILIFSLGFFVNLFYGGDWVAVYGLALIILFALILVTTSVIAVVNEMFK